jgi:biopolymer transport protein ExbB
MFTVLQLGGPLVWLIILVAFIGILAFVERWYYYHRAQIKIHDFLLGISKRVRANAYAEASTICEQETHSPVAQVARAAILNHDRSRDEIREAVDVVVIQEMRRLNRKLYVIASCAQVAPLLGLLGTVMGLISAFLAISQEGGLVNATTLAAGVWQALICTAAGLTAAIPGYIAYNYLISRRDEMVNDMELCATQMLILFAEQERSRRRSEFDLTES